MVDNPLREPPLPDRAEERWQENAIHYLRDTAEKVATELTVIAQHQNNPGAKADLLHRATELYRACASYDQEANRHNPRKATPDIAKAA